MPTYGESTSTRVRANSESPTRPRAAARGVRTPNLLTSAAPIATEQLTRLQNGVAKSYGRDVKLNLVIDPTIIGGLRVQLGDDVIDGTVSRKLSDLRLQLAG